ncbi:DAK2 domain-containing protein [Solihabitans fulvus]|uniref:DAK2 domain-containing protein n=1 Tax=Solihabitans fulvus TaxID=1892852 RepID=A0A5B2WSM0_9PSEU|nr:DAK2 domain-containing protein [Solihabitans fulvus]KAA2253556.1 DAK2 domain-containing protein [Solihabitans fulvus]
MVQALDAAAVRRWADACVRSLDSQREAIDRINVYPVPDGDTGTNLLHTMRSALDALMRAPAEASSSVGPAVAAMARGALAGARGNSGVIVSQVLRGLAEVLQGTSTASGAGLRRALRRADELATAAVAEPAVGTVLTVLHAAADAAADSASDELDDVVTSAAGAAATALAETTRQLAALARAGVVDAGGRGLVVLLDALAAVVTGREEPRAERIADAVLPRTQESLTTGREGGSAEYDYEVMYLLDGVEESVEGLRGALGALGDCVSVVGDGAELWTVHVHCNDIGAAIEAGIRTGRPHRITVARFADQIAAQAARFVSERVVVALVRGAGAAELFRGEGAVALDLCAAGDVTEADLLAVISGTRASQVIVLPGDTELVDLAEEARRQAMEAGQDVLVVPTSSPVQSLAALAVHDPGRRADDDAVAMAEAAAATRRGELTVSGREALTWVGRCQPGDLLGLLDGEVVLIEAGPADADDVSDAACRLVDRMLGGGGELVTALLGGDAPDGLAETLEQHLRASHPGVELTAYVGGQPDALLLFGVE